MNKICQKEKARLLGPSISRRSRARSVVKCRSKQPTLGKEFDTKREFGGSLLKKSHAKSSRPISTKQAMHLTLKSSFAKGSRSFLATRNRRLLIEKKIHDSARNFGVRVYRLAIVGNHIHLLVRATYRRGFIAFLRSISGGIARLILGAERGQPKLSEGVRFWDQRPWTRVVAWMKDFVIVRKYVEQNFKEAMGFAPYKSRKFRSSA